MPTASDIYTGYGILEVTWEESTEQRGIGVELGEISRELDLLSKVVGLASAIASGLDPDAPPLERVRSFDPRVHRVNYGSPLFAEIALLRGVIHDAAAMAFLIYILKRAWGFDLELKAHREFTRQRFIEAKQKADAAQERVDRALEERWANPDKSSQADLVGEEIEDELGWGREAATFASGRRRERWGKARGTMRIDDH